MIGSRSHRDVRLVYKVGWGKNPHPIIVIYLVTSVDLFKPLRQEIGWTYRQKKRMARENHPFALFFSFFACHSLPQSSRSQRIAPNPRAHRAEAPISNGVCSCDRRNNDLFLLVLIAHNIQTRTWKSGSPAKG